MYEWLKVNGQKKSSSKTSIQGKRMVQRIDLNEKTVNYNFLTKLTISNTACFIETKYRVKFHRTESKYY